MKILSSISVTAVLPLVIGIALAVAGCASPKLAPASFPEKLAVSSGGFFGDSFSITSDGDQLVYRRSSPNPLQSRTIRISPSEQQWQAFWAEADAVSVWKWKPSYKPRGIVNDGTHWHIAIEHEGRTATSEGDNAYPGDLNPAATSPEPGKRYRRFLTALRELAGGREFY